MVHSAMFICVAMMTALLYACHQWGAIPGDATVGHIRGEEQMTCMLIKFVQDSVARTECINQVKNSSRNIFVLTVESEI